MIAFENSSYSGCYTTEKIWNALLARTVPIYWGNPLVTRDFNPKAFINASDFDNFDDLVNHVKLVDNKDDLLLSYLNQPIYLDKQGNPCHKVIPEPLNELTLFLKDKIANKHLYKKIN